MKKYLVILATVALAASALAQGTVVFNNNSSGLVKQWTSGTDQTLISVPKSGGSVQLFSAPTGSSLTPIGVLGAGGFTATYNTVAEFLAVNQAWRAVATTGILPIAAGQYNGGTQTLPSITAGGNAQYFVLGWNGAFANYDDALAAGTGMIGASSVFTTSTGGSGTPPSTATPLNQTFTGMTLATMATVIPEPSTFALAGLGAAALLIFRRRK